MPGRLGAAGHLMDGDLHVLPGDNDLVALRLHRRIVDQPVDQIGSQFRFTLGIQGEVVHSVVSAF